MNPLLQPLVLAGGVYLVMVFAFDVVFALASRITDWLGGDD
jgi:hypothetical protein